MTRKNIRSDKYITGEGVETSSGVVLLSAELTCRVCEKSEFFEWPERIENEKELEGIEAISLIAAIAHSKNWIVQRVMNEHSATRVIFVLCPTCLSLFFSATDSVSR